MFSYNLWSFAGWWVSDSTKLFGLTYQRWGIMIYFSALIFILLPLYKNKNFKNNYLIYFASALASFAFFLFLTRIHQRYLLPFFAFLLITALIKKSEKLIAIYIVLSIIHFINLIFVYYYYNYVYPDAKFSSFFLYQFLNINSNWFSLINLSGFVLLVLIYYKFSYDKKIT